MKQHKRLATTLLGLAAAGGAALAGEDPAPHQHMPPPPSGGCDWCQCLTDKFGEPLYQNDDAMLIQAVRFFGRAQFQFAGIDGEDVNGNEFSDTFDEIRRLRFGAEVKALKYFTLSANANFANDQTPTGGDRDIGYDSLDVALVTFDAGALLGGGTVDSLKLNYGRHKVSLGHEVHTSSKKIKTVERSAPANKLYPERLTGGSIDATRGNLSATLGVFSTDQSDEIADWSAGAAFYASATAEVGANGDTVTADFLYNDANGNADNQVSDNVGMDLYEWAVALAYVAERGKWEFLAQGSVGDNGDGQAAYQGGTFWGAVAMASYDVTEKLEAVARYSYQGADEDQGIRSNSRYLRRNHGGAVDGGYGDEHHSIYGGLNYFLCGHNAKIMAGVEWETLETMGGDVDALTWWLAFRAYF